MKQSEKREIELSDGERKIVPTCTHCDNPLQYPALAGYCSVECAEKDFEKENKNETK